MFICIVRKGNRGLEKSHHLSRTSGWDHRAWAVFTSLCAKACISTPTLRVRNNLQGISLSKCHHCGQGSKTREWVESLAKAYLTRTAVPAHTAQNPAESLMSIRCSETNFLQHQSQGAELRALPTQGHLGRTEGQPEAQKRVYNPIKVQVTIASAKK